MLNRLWIIVLLLLVTTDSYALRVEKPKKITEFNEKDIVAINESIENLWKITNGRYNLNITTTNPDGTTRGTIGDMILYNNSGTYYLEINVDSGTTWRGVLLQNTP